MTTKTRVLNWTCVVLFISTAAIAPRTYAQTSQSTGAVRGTVTDPSGAVIPNATVVLANPNLAIRRETKTHKDGTYLFTLIPPGIGYEVDVTAGSGFSEIKVGNIVVQVTEITDAPVHVTVATTANRVVVTSAASLVQTANATTGDVLPEKVISVLPLVNRNTLQLLGTDPGVASDADGNYFAAGNRSTFNNYSVNGIDSNNFEFNDLTAVPVPNPDAVQELRTQTSLYDASVGRNSGIAIALITRSGTEHYHGTFYEYNRNRSRAATGFFLKRAGIHATPFNQNQFGGSIGGPLPDKKTLFFFNYEGLRRTTGSSVNGFQPVLPASRDAASIAAAFHVPQSAIDPVALNILNLPGIFGGKAFPSGNGTVGELGTFNYAVSSTVSENQFTARVDRDFHLFGGTNRISGVYFQGGEKSSTPNGISDGFLSSGGAAFTYRNNNASVNDTQIITSNLLNDLNVGYTRYRIDGNNSVSPILLSQIGMTRFNGSQFPQAPFEDFTDSFSGYGTYLEAMPQQNPWTYSLSDIVTYSHGQSTFRWGFQGAKQFYNFNETYGYRGLLLYAPVFADSIYGPPPVAAEDISLRDFLIGAPLETTVSSGIVGTEYRALDLAAFFQDDYRATRRLTLNLGLRWEYFGNIYEKNGLISSYDPSRVSPAAAQIGGPGILAGFLIPAGEKYGVPGVSKSTMYNQDWKNFAPRVGFAYDVLGNGKLAVRGGYGIYYNRISATIPEQTTAQIPFGQTVTNFGFNGTQILHNPFPTLPQTNQFPVLPTPPQLTGYDSMGNPLFTNPNSLVLTELDPRSHTPYTHEYNLTVQNEFAPAWVLEVGYIGSRGLKLLNDLSFNDALLRNGGNPAAFGLTTNSSANLLARVPTVGLSQFSSNITTNADSYYNGLILSVQHRFANNLFLKASYTYSKAIDDDSAAFGFDITGPPGNQFLPYLNRALSDFDQPQRLIVTYVYTLPGPHSGIARRLLADWQISGFITYNSGFPFTVLQNTNGNTLSGTDGFADKVPGCNPYTGSLGINIQYLNPACYADTPVLSAGQSFGPLSPQGGPGNQMYSISPNGVGQLQGNSGRNTLRAPYYQDWDFSLAKTFPIHNALSVQVRGDAFNLWNHPIFAAPSATTNTGPGFGQIFSTYNTPRIIQLSGRFSF
jgi:Carboxypeptidase regulatory-like domain